MREAITRKNLKALLPRQTLTDEAGTGLVVRCLPSGKLSYALRYWSAGKRCWKRLGVGLTPDAARAAADILKGRIAQGRDPLAEERRQPRRPSAGRNPTP